MSHEVPFSPVALVGTIALFGAYLVAAWCVAAGIAGNARKNRKLVNSSVYGLYGFVALVALASAMMIYAFVTHDFAIKYVASVSDTTMPVWYKITAFWGGLDGSLLFWVLVLSLFSCVAIATNHKRHRDMIGYVVATIMVVQVFFLSLLIFTKNPFSTFLTQPPTEGQGLNPLLQNYWMVIHPPSLYTGFVASTIPFAFGIGALASGRLDDLWLGSVRVWMLICFFFLSFGLILGGRWAYEELGWGGYWAWDPVENAGLIPWFTATAFLHSAIIQEQKGMMKGWNLVLVTLTFFFTIFGTFMTRSGVVQSVHAFGEDNVLALQFVAFMALILVVSLGLIVYRSNKLSTKTQFESFYSREFAFLLNNWILLGCAVFVLFATMFPTIYEAFAGSRASVGIEFFNKWMTPFALTLLVLAGGAPLLAWRQTTRERLKNQLMFPVALTAATIVALLIFVPDTTHLSALFADSIELPISLVCFGCVAFVVGSIGQEFVRGVMVRRKQTGSDPFTSMIGLVVSKRRKYGGYIVHLGVALMFIGFAGKAYDQMVDRTIDKPALTDGRTSANPEQWWRDNMDNDGTLKRIPKDTRSAFPFRGYVFVYENLIHTSDDHKDAVTAQVSIWKDGSEIGVVYPAKWDYHKQEAQQTTEVAITVRFSEDVYLVLTGYDMESQQANFRVYINPLISWVWIGFMVVAAGVFVCLLPQRLLEWMFSGRLKVGNLAILAIVIAVSGGAARADGGEHVQAGMGMGAAGGGYAAMNRPKSDLEAKAMKELLCPCNCSRQNVFECDCATAAKLRGTIMERLAGMDTTTDAKREAAYDTLLAGFVKEYGGEQVLSTPRSNSAWLLPVLAIGGGLGLLVVVGRRWMKPPTAPPPPTIAADEAYADKLDDELAETD